MIRDAQGGDALVGTQRKTDRIDLIRQLDRTLAACGVFDESYHLFAGVVVFMIPAEQAKERVIGRISLCDLKFDQTVAIAECSLTNIVVFGFCAKRRRELHREHAGVLECIVSDAGDALSDRQIRQRGAVEEGVLRNGSQCTGDHDLRQLLAVVEGTLTHGFQLLGEFCRGHIRIFKGACVDPVDRASVDCRLQRDLIAGLTTGDFGLVAVVDPVEHAVCLLDRYSVGRIGERRGGIAVFLGIGGGC